MNAAMVRLSALCAMLFWIKTPLADEKVCLQLDEKAKKIVIDFACAETVADTMKQLQQSAQYTIEYRNYRVGMDSAIIMLGKFYSYKKGYSGSFCMFPFLETFDSAHGMKSVEFSLYTESECGYYTFRLIPSGKAMSEEFRQQLNTIEKSKTDPSLALKCIYGLRLYVRGEELTKIHQFDCGLSLMFPTKNIDKPISVFLINAYPFPFLVSYKTAFRLQFLSRISISAGIGLSSPTDEGNGDKNFYFAGIALPVVFDFSVVGGVRIADKPQWHFGVQIDSDLLGTALGAMKKTKAPDL